MSVERDIKETIRGIAGRTGREILFQAEVKSVSDETCDVEDDGVVYKDVMLTAVGGYPSALNIKPTKGSTVVVADLSQGDRRLLMVAKYTEVESVSIWQGKNGGLCNVPELKKQLERMSKRIDTIIDAINNATPSPQDGGASLKSTMMTTLQTILQKEDFSEIEDERFKH